MTAGSISKISDFYDAGFDVQRMRFGLSGQASSTGSPSTIG